jgi:hypothetical protein
MILGLLARLPGLKLWYFPFMSQAADPAPGMPFTEALRILEDRYGIENIEYHPINGNVVIYLASYRRCRGAMAI